MRTGPSSVDFSNIALGDGVNPRISITAVTLNAASTQFALCSFTVASGVTTYRPYFILNQNSTNAYLGLSAEL